MEKLNTNIEELYDVVRHRIYCKPWSLYKVIKDIVSDGEKGTTLKILDVKILELDGITTSYIIKTNSRTCTLVELIVVRDRISKIIVAKIDAVEEDINLDEIEVSILEDYDIFKPRAERDNITVFEPNINLLDGQRVFESESVALDFKCINTEKGYVPALKFVTKTDKMTTSRLVPFVDFEDLLNILKNSGVKRLSQKSILTVMSLVGNLLRDDGYVSSRTIEIKDTRVSNEYRCVIPEGVIFTPIIAHLTRVYDNFDEEYTISGGRSMIEIYTDTDSEARDALVDRFMHISPETMPLSIASIDSNYLRSNNTVKRISVMKY